jgi:deazaflavin-dependent oxidoreductase (nitroreductase family)
MRYSACHSGPPDQDTCRAHLRHLRLHRSQDRGRPHEAVAIVLRYNEATGEVVICAAYGPDTDWVRNLRAAPAARVQLGADSFVPEQRFLSDDEALDVFRDFRRQHPARLQLFRTALGWDDLRREQAARTFVQTHPLHCVPTNCRCQQLMPAIPGTPAPLAQPNAHAADNAPSCR